MKLLSILTIIVSMTLHSCVEPGKNSEKVNDKKGTLKSGQIWEYETRTGEENSRLIILKVEESDKGETIVHVSVSGLAMINSQQEKGMSEDIGHLPFAEEALIECLTKLESSDNELPPDYMEGYKIWKEAYDSGEGGVFTISVKEAVDFVERSVNR
jgi:hypothetical protein